MVICLERGANAMLLCKPKCAITHVWYWCWGHVPQVDSHNSVKKTSSAVPAFTVTENTEQMICIWSSWRHSHPVISYFVKIQNDFTFLVPAYPGFSGNEAIKWVSVCFLTALIIISFAHCKVSDFLVPAYCFLVNWPSFLDLLQIGPNTRKEKFLWDCYMPGFRLVGW